jgi:hypothetical protein
MDFSEFETARGGIWRICAVIDHATKYCFAATVTPTSRGQDALGCLRVRPATTRWTTWRILPKASTSSSALVMAAAVRRRALPRERRVLRLTTTGGPRLRR